MTFLTTFLTTIVVPVILIITGILKLIGVINTPQDGLFGSAAITSLVVLFEYLLAFRLLARRNLQTTTLVALFFFLFGMLYNTFLFAKGVPTCGCVGVTEISPVYMAVFDAIVVLVLFAFFKMNPPLTSSTSEVWDVFSLASIITIVPLLGLFVFSDNPKETIDRLRGEKLITVNYIDNGVKELSRGGKLTIKVKNVSSESITLVGYNSTCNSAMFHQFPIVIKPNSEIDLDFNMEYKKIGQLKTILGLFFTDNSVTKTKVIKIITDVRGKS